MMKKWIIFAVMILLSGACLSNNVNAAAKQSKPKLSETKITLKVGTKKTIKVKKIGKNAKIKWSSNRPKIVTVSKKGVAFAKASGNAVIKATVKQKGKKIVLKCKINVPKPVKDSVNPLPVADVYKKNTLFDTYLSGGVSAIHYNINNTPYVVTDTKKITSILTYMSLLEVEQTTNPNVAGGFSMILSVPDRPMVTIGLLNDTFSIDGQYYKIKNSTLDITTVIQLFLGL